MNTEINFLEKQQKKTSVPAFLLVLFVVLLIIAAGLVFVQQQALTQSIDTEQSTLSTLQSQVAEAEENLGNVSQLEKAERALTDMKQNMMPRVALYEDVLHMLNTSKQLNTVSYEGKTDLSIEADFSTLSAVADYVGELLENVYVTDTELTDVSEDRDGYIASLTLTLDPDALREELGSDAE